MLGSNNNNKKKKKRKKSKNMQGKAIKHIIDQEKAMKRKRCGLYLKSYIHNPKPQIQDMELR